MEQQRYLIDTNAAIDYLGNKLPLSGMSFMNVLIDAVPIISIITKIEVLGFVMPGEHNKLLLDFINDCSVLALSNDIADECIIIRKVHKTKLPDAIIAATALVNNLTLITRNISDFKNIEDLKVINPHEV
jgi:predicted nucleic acid-binding protein